MSQRSGRRKREIDSQMNSHRLSSSDSWQVDVDWCFQHVNHRKKRATDPKMTCLASLLQIRTVATLHFNFLGDWHANTEFLGFDQQSKPQDWPHSCLKIGPETSQPNFIKSRTSIFLTRLSAQFSFHLECRNFPARHQRASAHTQQHKTATAFSGCFIFLFHFPLFFNSSFSYIQFEYRSCVHTQKEYDLWVFRVNEI